MMDNERRGRWAKVIAMVGNRRKDAARTRLNARCGEAADAELANRTLKRITDALDTREPLSGDVASDEVAAEVNRMRVEKRAKDFVAAMTEPRG